MARRAPVFGENEKYEDGLHNDAIARGYLAVLGKIAIPNPQKFYQ